MYFSPETMHAARLAALDHYRAASNIFLDSTERLISLYGLAGSKALDLASHQEPESLPDPTMFHSLIPEIWKGHLVVASHAHEDMVHFVETQIHASGNLARAALEKTALWSSPVAFPMVQATETMIDAGVEVADDLGEALIDTVEEAEQSLIPAR